jgi:tetratricopeptide (TPR) repeat protein
MMSDETTPADDPRAQPEAAEEQGADEQPTAEGQSGEEPEAAEAALIGEDEDVAQDETSITDTGAFLKGLTLLNENKPNPALLEFKNAMRTLDFSTAMIYLGACHAAAGNDKEAASVWRTALIREGDSAALHIMLADAQLRQGRSDLAVGDLALAQKRWPDDLGLKRRFAVAAMLSGKRAEGLSALDELIEKKADDEASLAIGVLVLYDAFDAGQAVETVMQDHERMVRLADTYRARGGQSQALIDTWVAAAAKKQ